MRRLWYRFLQMMSQVLFILVFQFRAYHSDRMPKTGGVLVVSNHQSFLDPILAALGVLRPFNPMARQSLFNNRAFAWLIRSLYAFPVRRRTADLRAIKEALRRLRKGNIVLMFPEGTRTTDGSIGRIQQGIVTIASRAEVPIVPVVIDGAFGAWPRNRRFPRPWPINVGYGHPIAPAVLAETPAERIVADIHKDMLALQAELHRREARRKCL